MKKKQICRKYGNSKQQKFIRKFIESIPAGYTQVAYKIEKQRKRNEKIISKSWLWASINTQKTISDEVIARIHRAYPKELPLSKISQINS